MKVPNEDEQDDEKPKKIIIKKCSQSKSKMRESALMIKNLVIVNRKK
jgi:hypothetical protein